MKTSLLTSLVLSLALSLTAFAQPSAGSYGPVPKRYELPKATHTYFVAPEGKAEASGASLSQPTSLESALARVVTGDAIILRGGVYRSGELRLNQGITMQPYADERPVLKGTRVATDWQALPEGRWRCKWDRLFPAAPADWWRRERHEKQTPLHLFNNDMLFVDGELYGAVGRLEDLKDRTYFIDYPKGEVTIATNPAGRLVEITAWDGCLTRSYREEHGKQNDHRGPVIRGITFTQYAYRAIEIEGVEPDKHMDPSLFGKEVTDSLLEDVTLSYCSRVAGYFRGDRLVIRNCLVADCGTEGLYVINSADVLLERNIVTRTNHAEKISGYYASAVKIFNQSYRCVVRDNLIIDNPDSSGVWYDVGNVDGVFTGNWVQNTNDGFFFEISKGVTCSGNVFVNCTPGVRILNSCNAKVTGNRFLNSPARFDRTERSAQGDHFGWHPSAGPDVTERHGHEFTNNLCVADDSFTLPLVEFTQSAKVNDRLRDPHVSQFDGNTYLRGAGKGPLVLWGPVPGAEKGVKEINSLDELRAIAPAFEARSAAYPRN